MGKITSIPPLSKDIVGMNGISLIRYSKFCKNKSSMRAWKKEWSTLICLEILFWLNFAFHSCNEGYIRALGSYIAPFTCMIPTMSVFVLQMGKMGTKDWGMRSHGGYWTWPQGKASKGARSGYANYQTNLSVFLIVNQLGWWWCLGTEVNTQWPITGIISESISYWNKGSEIGIGFLYFPKPPGKTLIYLAFWRQCKSVRH